MKCLTVHQPWAWAIIQGGKDVENRVRPTHYRGRLVIHAAKKMIQADYMEACRDLEKRGFRPPTADTIALGGIIGIVDLVDVKSPSRWFGGKYRWVLANPKPVPFYPAVGQLGLWNPPSDWLLMGHA